MAMTEAQPAHFRRHRFPAEIIAQFVGPTRARSVCTQSASLRQNMIFRADTFVVSRTLGYIGEGEIISGSNGVLNRLKEEKYK